MTPKENEAPCNRTAKRPQVASELNNLIQIISGTSELIENIWEGIDGSEEYFAMLRASIARAQQVTSELVAQWGGGIQEVVLAPEAAASAVPISRRIARPSVLVVDDEPMILSLFRRVLSDAGYELACAQSGFECLDLFRSNPSAFNLILLDLAMPLMDGEETFQRLRRICNRIPVVLTTGFCEEERLARLMKAGLRGYLRKPLRNQEILTLVRSLVGPGEDGRIITSGNGIAAAVQDA